MPSYTLWVYFSFFICPEREMDAIEEDKLNRAERGAGQTHTSQKAEKALTPHNGLFVLIWLRYFYTRENFHSQSSLALCVHLLCHVFFCPF
jgi:3-dehydroquinate dehydratase